MMKVSELLSSTKWNNKKNSLLKSLIRCSIKSFQCLSWERSMTTFVMWRMLSKTACQSQLVRGSSRQFQTMCSGTSKNHWNLTEKPSWIHTIHSDSIQTQASLRWETTKNTWPEEPRNPICKTQHPHLEDIEIPSKSNISSMLAL